MIVKTSMTADEIEMSSFLNGHNQAARSSGIQ